jgi:hypothetical protein
MAARSAAPSAAIGLIVLYLVVGAVVIPGLARTVWRPGSQDAASALRRYPDVLSSPEALLRGDADARPFGGGGGVAGSSGRGLG